MKNGLYTRKDPELPEEDDLSRLFGVCVGWGGGGGGGWEGALNSGPLEGGVGWGVGVTSGIVFWGKQT